MINRNLATSNRRPTNSRQEEQPQTDKYTIHNPVLVTNCTHVGPIRQTSSSLLLLNLHNCLRPGEQLQNTCVRRCPIPCDLPMLLRCPNKQQPHDAEIMKHIWEWFCGHSSYPKTNILILDSVLQLRQKSTRPNFTDSPRIHTIHIRFSLEVRKAVLHLGKNGEKQERHAVAPNTFNARPNYYCGHWRMSIGAYRHRPVQHRVQCKESDTIFFTIIDNNRLFTCISLRVLLNDRCRRP